jgi:mannose-6-phosphate isomerase-like protein (cupin superfamily)
MRQTSGVAKPGTERSNAMNRTVTFAMGYLALAIAGCASPGSPPPRSAGPIGGAAEAQATSAAAPSASEPHRAPGPAPLQTNILQAARGNDAYRRVLFTGARSQTVVMTIPAGQDIGVEMHPNVEQLIFIATGRGKAILNGAESAVGPGDLLVVTPSTRHDVVNTGTEPLRIYTVYVPPNHFDGRVHQTKAEAEADSADEAFGRSVR